MEARLDTVVQGCERTRKLYRPKPSRVVIDTSYVERAAQSDQAPAPRIGDLVGEHRADFEPGAAIPLPLEMPGPSGEAMAGHSEGEPSEDSALLQLALERWELAEANEAQLKAREAEARKEAESQRALVDVLTAKSAVAQTARREAEEARDAAVHRAEQYERDLYALREQLEQTASIADGGADAEARDDAMFKELEAQRAKIELLSAQALVARADRVEAEAERDQAVQRAEEFERQFIELQQRAQDTEAAEQLIADAQASATAACQQLEAVQSEADKLKDAAAEAEAGRVAAEALRDDAVRRAQESEQQLNELRETLETRQDDTARQLAEVLTREAALTQEVEAQFGQLDLLAAQVKVAKTARVDAQAERDEAIRRAEAGEQELAALREAAAQAADAERLHGEALAREADLRQALEAERDEAIRRAEAGEQELAALREAAAQGADAERLHGEALARQADLQQELEVQRDDALQRAGAGEQELEALRDRVELLSVELAAAQALRSDAPVEPEQTAQGAEDDENDPPAVPAAPQQPAESEDAAGADELEQRAVTPTTLKLRKGASIRKPKTAPSMPVADAEAAEVGQKPEPADAAVSPAIGAAVKAKLHALSSTTDTRLIINRANSGEAAVVPAAGVERNYLSMATDTPLIINRVKSGGETPAAQEERSVETEAQEPAAPKTERPARSGTITAKETPKPAAAEPQASEPAAVKKKERHAQRMASHMAATIFKAGASGSKPVIILDRSSSGAKLELVMDKFNQSSDFSVGDNLTLSFGTAKEQTSVACVVMWVNGTKCGVKYSGQFHTQIVQSRTSSIRRAKPGAAASQGKKTGAILGRFGKGK